MKAANNQPLNGQPVQSIVVVTDVNVLLPLVDYAFRRLSESSIEVEVPGPLRTGRQRCAYIKFCIDPNGNGSR